MQLRMDIVLQTTRKTRKSPEVIFNQAAIWSGKLLDDGRIYWKEWLILETIPRWVVEYCCECLRRKPDKQRRH